MTHVMMVWRAALLPPAAAAAVRSLHMATNLFDYESAAMLKDLLAGGLVDLAGSGGKVRAASRTWHAACASRGKGGEG